MKLSKTLLSAILVGITVQAATSCTKTSGLPGQKIQAEEKKNLEHPTPNLYPDNCPACGMG